MKLGSESEDSALPRWEHIVRRKLAAAEVNDRASIFIGVDIDTRAPICIPRQTLEDSHYHIRGMTGSGKTTASLMSLAFQILRGYELPSGEISEKCPMVVLDMKGDQALFNAVREAAQMAGQKFRYFSTRKNDDYHFFDPFQMFRLGHLMPIQLATQYIRAFSLDYGLEYGGHYFTDENLKILHRAVQEMLSRPNPELTIEILARILRRMAKGSNYKDARHIEALLEFLAAYPQVNVATNVAPQHQTIEMVRALEDCEVLYFFLQMDSEAPTLRQVASFALFTLVEAAKLRYYSGERRHTYVLIDEFYHIAGKSFGEFLSTVRGWGLHMVLANQSMAQLKNHDQNLPDVLSANIGAEQAFTLQSDDEEYFQRAAGETSEFLTSTNISTRSSGQTFSERKASYLTDADLKRVNDTRLASLVIINDGKPKVPGKRVLKVQGYYPTTSAEYQRYETTPFPQRPIAAIEKSQPAAKPFQTIASPPARTEDVRPEILALDERMAAKWRELDSSMTKR